MDNGEEKDTTLGRASGVLYARSQRQHVTRAQRVLLLARADGYFTFEHVDRDRPIGAMRGECSAWSNRNDRQPERSFLHQGAGAPTVPGEERTIDQPLVLDQMMDADIAAKLPLQ